MATPLKIARIRLGKTPGELAQALEVSQPTICRIENGRKRASPELAKRIAEYFDNTVTRDQVLFPEEYPEPSAKKPMRRALQEAS